MTILTEDVYRNVILRTCGRRGGHRDRALIACRWPSSWRRWRRRGPALLVIAILTPLWASYLVKAYAWRVMLAGDGVVDWSLERFGLQAPATA